jgi:hypothetical protein
MLVLLAVWYSIQPTELTCIVVCTLLRLLYVKSVIVISFIFSNAFYMPRPSQCLWCDHHVNIGWTVQHVKLFTSLHALFFSPLFLPRHSLSIIFLCTVFVKRSISSAPVLLCVCVCVCVCVWECLTWLQLLFIRRGHTILTSRELMSY